MNELFVYVYVCVGGGQMRVSHHLELNLHTVVSYHVGTGNGTQARTSALN